MAEYLQLILAAEDSVQDLISNHAIHLNKLQCEFLVSKLHVAVKQAMKVLAKITHSSDKYTPVYLFRHFYWEVKGVVTLVEKFGEKIWLRVAATHAKASESFILACLELEWFTAIFDNLMNQSGFIVEGISELAGQARMKETVERVATLAREDEDGLRLKLLELVNGSPSSDLGLARMLLQKLQHDTPHPDLWTLDATELIMGKSVGRGSSGIVYTTFWMNETYALKVFFKAYRETFEQEVAVLAGLNHPNVLPMIGSSVDLEGNCMLVVELMDEGLDTFIARKTQSGRNPLPLDEALDLMLQTAEGVQYLHQQRIVHRDLKSSNILVKAGSFDSKHDKSMQVKVADFGLSKTKEKSSTRSPLTKNIGTSRWMAPEILRTISEVLSDSDLVETLSYPFKVDIYSFALICYEILTGRLPYSNMHQNEMRRKVKDENMRPALPPSCPLGLAILFKRCWDADPKARPSFGEICKDLRHMKGHLLLEHSSVTLKPVSVVLNPDIPDYKRILSVDARRTYNKFTILKNNKIVDLISHRELTSKEIYKRVNWEGLPVSAWSIRPWWKISDFWPPSAQPHHGATSARATVVLSSLNDKIQEKMRRSYARHDFNSAHEATEDEVLQMFLSAANERFEHLAVVHPPVTQTQVEESLDNVHKFLEQYDDDDVSNLVDELSALKKKIAQLPDCPEKDTGNHYFQFWISNVQN